MRAMTTEDTFLQYCGCLRTTDRDPNLSAHEEHLRIRQQVRCDRHMTEPFDREREIELFNELQKHTTVLPELRGLPEHLEDSFYYRASLFNAHYMYWVEHQELTVEQFLTFKASVFLENDHARFWFQEAYEITVHNIDAVQARDPYSELRVMVDELDE